MLKVLHTADWHIGKNLHKVSLQEEIRHFLGWLRGVILKEDIDLLLVSGDVFDYANPSAEDRSMYFSFLSELVGLKTKVIITGGNHDSAGFLNAPKEILAALDINIVGEATQPITNEVIEIVDRNGELRLVVAAVPFLKDKDLRSGKGKDLYQNRADEMRAGIKQHYALLSDYCSKNYSGVPVIAMGHLYAVGSDPSESEREIHMGNEAAVYSEVFSINFNYVALGHIHRPQIVAKNPFIRYSGSPISLSFSEKNDVKSVVLLTIDKGEIHPPEILLVPKQRALVRLSGSLSEVKEKLEMHEKSHPLPTFFEVVVSEAEYSAAIIADFEQMKTELSEHPQFVIVKSKLEFEHGAKNLDDLFVESVGIAELKPIEVFMRKIENEFEVEEDRIMLRDAFIELMEQLENEN